MNIIRSFLRNQTIIYLLLLSFSIFLACCCNEYDFDLYARFIVGENFFSKGIFNYQDYLSYTPTHNWYDHEYGAGLVYYLFYKVFGAYGLILIQGLLVFFTGFFIIKVQQIQKHAYPTSLFFMALFLVFYTRQNPVLVRCHLFSFAFFAMFLYFLEKTRIGFINNKPSKILWVVPPLVVVWNNLHGGVISGLGIIFIYMISAIFLKQNWQIYLKVLIVSIPLLAINPYGPEYLKFLLSANTKNRTMISEWWDVFVPHHVIYYYPIFAAGLFTLLLNIVDFINRKKINLTKFLILLITLILGTIHVKLLSLPLIAICALFYNEIYGLLNKKFARILEIIAYCAVVVSIILIPLKHPFVPRTNINKFPIKEVEFIRINNIKGNILTEFGHGSYTVYKLYPDNLIFMDGRYEEVYYDKEFDNLMNFEQMQGDWLSVLRDYPTEIIMLQKDTPVYEILGQLTGWEKIYEGNVCGVFIKKENKKNKYIMPNNDINYYIKEEFKNNGFFGKKK